MKKTRLEGLHYWSVYRSDRGIADAFSKAR